MADIFLSYSRVDRPTAQIIAEALEAEGFSVWWDKILRAGQTYDEVTETMLRDSHVVIVLWSQTSVKSKWVRAEATQGQRNCVLVPAMIEDAERPIMFELTQTADLIGWSGDRSDERWTNYVDDLRRALEMPKPTGAAAQDSTPVVAPPTPVAEPTPPPKPAEVVATPAPTPAADAAPASVDPKKAKKSSNPLPMLIIGLAVLGGGGWYAYDNFLSDEGASTRPTADTDIASCEVCPEMVGLESGTFTMGSPDSEANRTGNEGPQREVAISAIRISKTEITRAQWQRCVDAGGCGTAQGGGAAEAPVTGISWDDAVGYANWLSQASGQSYRLPTEAEWEYAARSGKATAYWWGATYPGPGASASAIKAASDMPENAYGVSGMLGNVREWVADCYVNNYRNAPSDGGAVTTGDCSRPVVRGGSFKTGAAEHRAASRARFSKGTKDSALGFRVVAD